MNNLILKLRKEEKELRAKVVKILDFTNSENINKVSKVQKKLLSEQAKYMTHYLLILQTRIFELEKQNHVKSSDTIKMGIYPPQQDKKGVLEGEWDMYIKNNCEAYCCNKSDDPKAWALMVYTNEEFIPKVKTTLLLNIDKNLNKDILRKSTREYINLKDLEFLIEKYKQLNSK